jgi:putative transposase
MIETADSPNDQVMRQIDEIHMRIPQYGSRKIRLELKDLGYVINRKRVRRLMLEMGCQAVYTKPKTTQRNEEHRVYPYLLRGMAITRPNQVWCADITYIPMKKGFLYLVAIMDWYSRKVLSWRVSNSMDTSFCVDALQEAFARYGEPEIFNTDQGSQFTSEDFTKQFKGRLTKISMDGKGRWMDNVFIERLWRSLKYEEVYLKAYETARDARSGISEWFQFYNQKRYHQGLNDMRPDDVYHHNPTVPIKAVA